MNERAIAYIEELLAGGDLRSIGRSNSIVAEITSQSEFDDLIAFLFHDDKLLVMRSADAIEKITINKPEYLRKHKKKILGLSVVAKDKELKWHIALMIPRLPLNSIEFGKVWDLLTTWAKDRANSRIVRVNSIQGLFELMKQKRILERDFRLTLFELERENIPSISARIRILRKQMD